MCTYEDAPKVEETLGITETIAKREKQQEEKKKYYDENIDKFKYPKRVRASHILVETKEEADELHQQFEKEANENGYVLSAWTETLKERKSKGEVIESWYYCKATFVFNDQFALSRFSL